MARHDLFPIRKSSFPTVVQGSRVDWEPMPPELPSLYYQHSPRHPVTMYEKLCASERFGIPQSIPVKSRARTMTPSQECNLLSGKKAGDDFTGRSQGFRRPTTIGRDEIRQPSPSITLDPPPLLLSLPISSNPELFSGQRVQFETSPFLDNTNADWDQAVDCLPEADGYRMRFVDVSGALASPVPWLDKAT
ncbi:hypothetical protein GALMADRAFT_762463 [Galerina marginata CBS 339.88]|uniref:Uncharacterized protein n=1 Tax=Galerina marginata (strain CBS 339.88) TaxID=685588 RepID=A0A067SRP5_GALM3|nr:hypothetical protein GALMADRAFT_762463 [Galerina marginata CBS 339.88]